MKKNAKALNGMNPDKAWKYVQKTARLDDEEVWMAKRLKKEPIDVLRMIPDEKEPWKTEAALFIRRMYARRFGSGFYTELCEKERLRKEQRKEKRAAYRDDRAAKLPSNSSL